jgi:hypothetical protein
MLNYKTTFNNSAALDIFQGGGSTGTWEVQVKVYAGGGGVYLSTDGTTTGFQFDQDLSGAFETIVIHVKDQPLYLIAGSASNSTVGVIVTPVATTKITTC